LQTLQGAKGGAQRRLKAVERGADPGVGGKVGPRRVVGQAVGAREHTLQTDAQVERLVPQRQLSPHMRTLLHLSLGLCRQLACRRQPVARPRAPQLLQERIVRTAQRRFQPCIVAAVAALVAVLDLVCTQLKLKFVFLFLLFFPFYAIVVVVVVVIAGLCRRGGIACGELASRDAASSVLGSRESHRLCAAQYALPGRPAPHQSTETAAWAHACVRPAHTHVGTK
jgi:hypothetical protein